MEHDFEVYSKLTNKEQLWLQNKILDNPALNFTHLLEMLVAGPTGRAGGVANKKRLGIVQSLLLSVKNPAYNIVDSPLSIGNAEEELLGIAITASQLDNTHARNTCKDLIEGSQGKMKIAAKIEQMREWKTKDKQMMCFLHISDSTALVDNVVVFPNTYSLYNDFFDEENFLLFSGFKNEKGFIVTKVDWI